MTRTDDKTNAMIAGAISEKLGMEASGIAGRFYLPDDFGTNTILTRCCSISTDWNDGGLFSVKAESIGNTIASMQFHTWEYLDSVRAGMIAGFLLAEIQERFEVPIWYLNAGDAK